MKYEIKRRGSLLCRHHSTFIECNSTHLFGNFYSSGIFSATGWDAWHVDYCEPASILVAKCVTLIPAQQDLVTEVVAGGSSLLLNYYHNCCCRFSVDVLVSVVSRGCRVRRLSLFRISLMS